MSILEVKVEEKELPAMDSDLPLQEEFMCPAVACSGRFQRKVELVQHWKMIHERMVTKFHCPKCRYLHVKKAQVLRHWQRVHRPRKGHTIILNGRLETNHRYRNPGTSREIESFRRQQAIKKPLVGDILWRDEYICNDEVVDLREEGVFLHRRTNQGCAGKLIRRIETEY